MVAGGFSVIGQAVHEPTVNGPIVDDPTENSQTANVQPASKHAASGQAANGHTVMDCVDAIHAAIEVHQQEIARLDQEIGDGDHVYNVLRGLEALQSIRSTVEASDMATALKQSASKLLATIGGSSGPLFSSFLSGMSKTLLSIREAHGPRDWAMIYAGGVTEMQCRGKTGKGSKTMMDVLIPVAEHFQEMAAHGKSAANILEELPKEAERGMLSTKDMLATKGRASFLGDRSIGHIDPGARSSQIMISTVCEHLTKV